MIETLLSSTPGKRSCIVVNRLPPRSPISEVGIQLVSQSEDPGSDVSFPLVGVLYGVLLFIFAVLGLETTALGKHSSVQLHQGLSMYPRLALN